MNDAFNLFDIQFSILCYLKHLFEFFGIPGFFYSINNGM